MDEPPISLADIRAARERIAGRLNRTPLLSSATAARVVQAAAGTDIGDGRLYLKAEHLQKTGSFKPRAALNRLANLPPDVRARGAITVTAGNAGQAYAWAGRELGMPITVVMVETAVRSKVDACRGYGAEIVLHGTQSAEAFAEMARLRDERGLTAVHPFDDRDVIIGNGSLGLEILDDLPDVDVVVAGVGGGGMLSGVSIALKESRPNVRVYGVEPEHSNALSLALAAGQPVPIEPRSVADGLSAPFAGQRTLPIAQRYWDEIVLVDEATILAGLRFSAERIKQVIEPAASTALGAVLAGRIPLRDGDRVCVILSGGNVELSRLGELIAAAEPVAVA